VRARRRRPREWHSRKGLEVLLVRRMSRAPRLAGHAPPGRWRRAPPRGVHRRPRRYAVRGADHHGRRHPVRGHHPSIRHEVHHLVPGRGCPRGSLGGGWMHRAARQE
jgi:hypothetical protein